MTMEDKMGENHFLLIFFWIRLRLLKDNIEGGSLIIVVETRERKLRISAIAEFFRLMLPQFRRLARYSFPKSRSRH